MDDEHDDCREREERAATEMRAESEDRAETEDRERPEPPVPEELEVYTPEEYQLAVQIKAHRLYKEEHGRVPYTGAELSHFLIKANIEIRPDDDDLKAARRKLEAAGS
jgi:hypothetical protein